MTGNWGLGTGVSSLVLVLVLVLVLEQTDMSAKSQLAAMAWKVCTSRQDAECTKGSGEGQSQDAGLPDYRFPASSHCT